MCCHCPFWAWIHGWLLTSSQEKQQGSALQNLACTLHICMTPDLLEVVGPFYTYYISAIFFPFHFLILLTYTAFSLLLLIPEDAYAYKAFGRLHCVPLRLAWNYYKESQRNREAILVTPGRSRGRDAVCNRQRVEELYLGRIFRALLHSIV